MTTEKIRQIEDYVRQIMDGVADNDHKIAHGFKHVDRVRRWALVVAGAEGFTDLSNAKARGQHRIIYVQFVRINGKIKRDGFLSDPKP